MGDTALSLMMLTALAMLAGAVLLWRRGERQRPLLMLAVALVLGVNVAIWSV